MSPSDRTTPSGTQARTVESLMKRGLELHQAGRGEEAATFYSKAMRIERDHPDANHLFGLVELHRGRPAAAVRHIAIARASRPNDPQILANMGVALSAADRHEDAVEVLQQAVSINPQFAEAHANLGRAYRLMGRFDDAVAAYSRAIEVKPTEASFHYHLGNSLRLAGYIFEAESAYRIAFERRPNHGPAYGQLAFMLVKSRASKTGAWPVGKGSSDPTCRRGALPAPFACAAR